MLRVALLALAISLTASSAHGATPPTTYERDSFRSCLEDNGAVTFLLREIPTQGAFTKAVRSQMVKQMPGAFGVSFPGGQISLVYVAKNPAAATSGWSWLERERSMKNGLRPLGTSELGNLLIFDLDHPTLGAEKIVARCERAAAR